MTGNWWTRIPRPLRWIGTPIVVLLLLIVAAGLTDWNFARGFVSRVASRHLARTVSIDGALRLRLLSTTPNLTITGLRIANPGWAGGGNMLQLQRLHVELQLSQLFLGRLVLRTLELEQPHLSLQRDTTQRANWDFGTPSSAGTSKPTRLPLIRHFVLSGGTLDLDDALQKLTFHGTVAAEETGGGARAEPFGLQGHGTLNKEPFDLKLDGGALLNIDPNRPYPFKLEVNAGGSSLALSGSIAKPFDFARFDVEFHVQGQNLANLYYVTGLALPLTAAYQISAQVHRDNMHFTLNDIAGRLGNSDVSGHATVDVAANGRPNFRIALTSKSLDLADLGIAFGAGVAQPGDTADHATGNNDNAAKATKAAKAPKAANAGPAELPAPSAQPISPLLLPTFQFQFDRLAQMDASFELHADSIKTQKIPINAVNLSLKLDHSVLTIDPVDFDLPLGKLTAQLRLDASATPPQASVDMHLTDVNLEQFRSASATATTAPLSGALQMHAHLDGQGNSVHEIAADSNGQLAAVIPHGEIRQALAELTGIDVLNGVGLLLTGDHKTVPIRCAVIGFHVTNGDAQAAPLVIDTEPVLITGNGQVTLSDEKLDLNIAGKPKKIRFTRIRAPINLRGTLRHPSISLSVPSLIKQGSIAAVAGTLLTPAAALLAFIDPGLAKDQNCSALLAAAP
jgi:uncharacterized protein involved in outer membrane biogenesis